MLIEIITHTPLWVFGLLVLLVYLGWQQSRERVVNKYVIFLLPVGMVALSYFGMLSSFGPNFLPITLWLVSLLVTALIVVTCFTVHGVTYDSNQARYTIQGSWFPFGLMMAIFFTKYAVGVVSALSPDMVNNQIFIVLCSLLYGIFSGIFMARAYSIWHVSRNNVVGLT